MIKRIWHGWTSPENADTYETLVKTEVFSGIFSKNIPGFEHIELLRREHPDEVEFVTVMTFTSLESVKAFVGPDYRISYVPTAARAVLKRFDEHAQHYDVRETRRVSQGS